MTTNTEKPKSLMWGKKAKTTPIPVRSKHSRVLHMGFEAANLTPGTDEDELI